MKVLVTGATGIVGSNLARALLDASDEVRVLVRPASDLRGIEGLDVDRRVGDVMDAASVASAASGCEVVYHAAALFSYSAPAAEQEELALAGTRNVLHAARRAGARRVVVTSSSVVLGSSSAQRVRDETAEFDEPNPAPYTLSKVRQEEAAFGTGSKLGLEVVAVCPTLVVGAFDYRLSPSNANIVNYLNDPFRSTFLGGCNIVSARDVASGHILAANHGMPGCRYILGSENLTWPDVHALISELAGTFGPSIVLNHTASFLAAAAAEVAARLAGSKPMVTRAEAQMAARFYWYDHARMAQLGYTPVAARQALAEAIAWLLGRTCIADTVAEKLKPSPEVLEARKLFTAEVCA